MAIPCSPLFDLNEWLLEPKNIVHHLLFSTKPPWLEEMSEGRKGLSLLAMILEMIL
jgi:hypothetical protein